MAGGKPEGEVVALRPALAVHADALAVRGAEPLPERQVRASESVELGDQLVGVIVAVAEMGDPQGLVVADDRRRVLGDDPAVAAADDELAIGEVAEAFQHGPLARLRRRPDVGPGLGEQRAGWPPRVPAWTSAGSSSPSAASRLAW